jgi:predicted ATPase
MRLLLPSQYQLIKIKLPAVAAAKLFLHAAVTQKSSSHSYKLRMFLVQGFPKMKNQRKLT